MPSIVADPVAAVPPERDTVVVVLGVVTNVNVPRRTPLVVGVNVVPIVQVFVG